ncbi:MFS transporter [Sutcliffiella sp. NC1]|uniref:MFS transporter n=1 Tax=Sutcliffiella sp. NC1 TaxID=3004096 RepID=UPI0022DE7427|nr:MFS transporter [Sutcliffiella sp. NC1]WBL14254.1 MFS transporter [Sutcliffiella sp. NC1]
MNYYPYEESFLFTKKAARNSFIVLVLVFFSVYFGSERLGYVDLALYGYLWATIVCFVLLTIRITSWTLRPPTRRLWKQGIKMMLSPKGLKFVLQTLYSNIGEQKFIRSRSFYRWIQHMFISWGVLISFGITFALVLNWLHFELEGTKTYVAVFFGIPLFRMPADSIIAIIIYHGLNWAGIAVIIGCGMAMYRRVTDQKKLVEQSKEYDFFPLILLIAISITGSLLTVSAIWMEGFFYMGMAIIHQVTVIVFLLYFPFSKFWHLPLRFLAVVVPMYHAMEEQKPCVKCGREYATKTQISDVQLTLQKRHLPLPIDNTEHHFSDMCAECRRVSHRLGGYNAKIKLEHSNLVLESNGRNGLQKGD